MFSVATLPKLCATFRPPSKLIIQSAPVALTVGRSFSLDRLVITALDESGKRIAASLPAKPL